MSDHDLNELRRGLQTIPTLAALTLQRLEDLHTLAYDRHVGERGEGRSTRQQWYLDDIGERQAKDLWRRALKTTHNTIVELSAVCIAIDTLLNAGELPDNTMRGTTLGDAETSATAELANLLKRQRARNERGDYTPNREWFQPQVPRR